MKALTLYRPRVLENALSDFDRYLDSFFRDNFLAPSERSFNRLPSNQSLLVDVHETEKAYILEAELPGYDEKDIEIRLDGNNLTIESKKEVEKKDENEKNYLIRERLYSSFSRTFKLPENAESEGISASFKNGILSLEIKKKAVTQSRVIQIAKN